METHEPSDGTLVVSHDGTLFPKWLFGLAAIFAATAIYDLSIGSRGTERLIGLIGGIVTFVMTGIAVREKSRFVFDPFKQTIVWGRTWGFGHRSGVLAFEQVEQILVQTAIGDSGLPSRRISLENCRRG